MKITHCIASIDESTGGPARSVTHLVEQLAHLEQLKAISIATLNSDNPLIDGSLNSKIKIFFSKPLSLKYSTELKKTLLNIETNLFHGHGLWELPIHQMAQIARARKVPYLISIRGMLEPWSLTQAVTKKKIAMFLFQKKDIKKATCLHATGQMELQNIRALGFTNPIADIPNGIKTEQFPIKDYSKEKSIKKILFLSRIHPKKGIEDLIEAWEQLEEHVKLNWVVEIVGNGDEAYIQKLKELIQKKSLHSQISLVGSKFEQEKIAIYHSADLFVLPTYSENFGIVIAEAMCCGLPVITTKGTPWHELEEVEAGNWIEIGVEPLKIALQQMMTKSDSEREIMGRKGRKLIEEHYSIKAVADKFALLYEWLLNKGEKPDFVCL